MHMGAMAVIASRNPTNFKHIVFNNESHDSVGGQPTVMDQVDLSMLAKSVGYPTVFSVQTEEELNSIWSKFYCTEELTLLEIKIKNGARKENLIPLACWN